jgi:hypothetical protein
MRLVRAVAAALALWGAVLSYLVWSGRLPPRWLPEPAQPPPAPVAKQPAPAAPEPPPTPAHTTEPAAPPPPPPAQPAAIEAARYAVCAREELPPRLSSLRAANDGPELFALHCGPSVHVLAFEATGGALVARRVLRARVPSRSPAEAPRPVPVRAADVDGDGRPDLIIPALYADRGGAPAAGALALLRQRAEGGFDAPRRMFDAAIGDVAPATLDAQPGTDLAVLHMLDARTARANELWLVHGGPAPLRYAQRPAGVAANALAAADLDRDGLDDIVVVSEHEQQARVWLSSHASDPQAAPIELSLPGVREVIAGDVDGDGQRDVVLTGASVSLLLSAKDFRAEPVAIADSAGLRDVELTDVDGDGKLDLVGYAHPALIALRQGEALAFARSTLAVVRGEFGVLAARAVQLDGDARPDLLLVLMSNAADAQVEIAIAANVHDAAAVEPAGHVESAADATLAEHFDLP